MTVVYSALFGDSDRLKPPPPEADRAVLFTDQPLAGGAGQGWEVQQWPPRPHPRQRAWAVRSQPAQVGIEAECVIWADASFRWLDLPGLLRDAGTAPCAGFAHPVRQTCEAEGATLVALGRLTAGAVQDQLATYTAAGYVPTALTTAGLLVRRASPAVRAFNAGWARELETWPGETAQLSLDYCAWAAGLPIHHLQGHYVDNPYVLYDHKDHKRRRRASTW